MGVVKHRAVFTCSLSQPISGAFGFQDGEFYSGLKWLLPGRFVKRWLLVSGIGILFTYLGLGIWLTRVPIDWEGAIVWLQDAVRVLPGPAAGAIAIVFGLFLVIWGQVRAATSMTDFLAGSPDFRQPEATSAASGDRGPKVAVIGGGKGMSGVLRGLKYYRATVTACVDLAADRGWSASFKSQYPSFDLRSHPFTRQSRPLPRVPGLQQLALQPRPVRAGFPSGVATSELPLSLSPEESPRSSMLQERVRAIREADYIVVGPGSLYTHLIPNLLVPEIRDAIAQAKVPRVYVCNIMTEPGETDGCTVAEHLRAIHRACGCRLFDAVLVQSGSPSARSLMRYAQENIHPVYLDREEVEELGCEAIAADVMQEDEKTGVVRHHPRRLARALLNWYEEHPSARSGLTP